MRKYFKNKGKINIFTHKMLKKFNASRPTLLKKWTSFRQEKIDKISMA